MGTDWYLSTAVCETNVYNAASFTSVILHSALTIRRLTYREYDSFYLFFTLCFKSNFCTNLLCTHLRQSYVTAVVTTEINPGSDGNYF